jgi:ABC-2 type transport system ATP-binding protein
METKSIAIHAQGLTRRFGDFTAVDGIDFEVFRGEIFGFLGPNGSGKTTTIRMMLGLLPPSGGNVDVLGVNAIKEPRKIRQLIGYMSQRFSLYNDLTVQQNLEFRGKAYGLNNQEMEQRLPRALHLAGLEGREKSLTRDLSGGWRQRLALGAAILHNPEIVFLDEPTAGVDPVSRRAFWDLLYQLSDEGVTVFVTTHYMDEAEHCHRLAFIQRGKIIAYGSPESITQETMSGQVLEIEPLDSRCAMKVMQGIKDHGEMPIMDLSLYGSLLHVVIMDAKKYKESIARELNQAGCELMGIQVIEPTLEDVFINALSHPLEGEESEGSKSGG